MVRFPLTASSLSRRVLTAAVGFLERFVLDRHGRQRRAREVVADRVGDDEVAVGEPLHQCARAEPVGPVVREVGLAEHVKSRQIAHQVVVHPEPAHRVVDGGIDPHRHLVRIVIGDPPVHVEQVPVPRLDRVHAEAFDRVGEVQIDGESGVANAPPLVADALGVSRRHVAGHEVAEARIAAFEIVVALGVRNLRRRPLSPFAFGTQTRPSFLSDLAHQRQLALVIAAHRDAGRMDLREARVRKERAALVRAPRRGHVRVHRVGRQVVRGSVAAGRQHHRVRRRAVRSRRSPGCGRRCRAPCRR